MNPRQTLEMGTAAMTIRPIALRIADRSTSSTRGRTMTRGAPGGHDDAWYGEIFGPDGVGTREAEGAARRLARSGQIQPSAVEDVAQDIKIGCFLALAQYDPSRG